MRLPFIFLLITCSIFHSCTSDEEEIIPILDIQEIIIPQDTVQIDTMTNCAIDTLPILCTVLNEDTIRIRVVNMSDFTIENVVTNFIGDEVFYGSLAPADSSDYECYAYAWSTAIVSLSVECDTLVFEPIDAVGERVLENRRHTLEINVLESGNRYDRIRIKVVDDE